MHVGYQLRMKVSLVLPGVSIWEAFSIGTTDEVIHHMGESGKRGVGGEGHLGLIDQPNI
ncbi:unnamed protein product [Brassica rapa subsp. trilocularis]